MDYGFGAVFGCPAHDQRDLDFALKYELDVKTVVKPNDEDNSFKVKNEAYTGPGKIFNSEFLDGLKVPEESISKTIDILEKKKFYLGICIGMQVLSSIGYENKKTNGLDIIEGNVKIFNSGNHNIKLPHVGWNDVKKINNSELFNGIKNYSDFYFDHSYVMEVKDDAHSTSLTDYNKIFISSVKNQNVYGVQFHPEKSSENGKKILSNFLKLWLL